jgi:hypothetical protein
MPLALVIGLGALAWYAWSHDDVRWENPLTEEEFLELYQAGLLPPEYYR